jgi:CheY-like chemotaxis protein
MSLHRILIVEHQHEVSRLLRSALETLEADLEVVEIPSGEEAILYSSRNEIDLLVSDFRLPGISGIELMHKVKKNHPQARIILVTGQPDLRMRKEVAEAGADAFFIKPVPMADFLEAVERQLGLVETILPLPEPISIEQPGLRARLPDLLAGLRKDLAASAVLILNDSGQILARAGDLPDKINEQAIISALLSIHHAGQKMSPLLGQIEPSNRTIFNGGDYDLVYAPVGLTDAMLVIGKGIAGQDKVYKTIDIFLAGRKNIDQLTSEQSMNSLNAKQPPSTALEEERQNVQEFEPLLKKAKKKHRTGALNAFWNKAIDQHIAPVEPDMLSYEQAKKLGLAPKDES